MGSKLILMWSAWMLPLTAWSLDVDDIIRESALSARLNPALWGCLIKRESNRNPYALNVRGKGYHPDSLDKARQTLDHLPRTIRLQLRFPWKVSDKDGYIMRFGTESAALKHTRERSLPLSSVKWDAPSIDFGLSQINWYWHGRQFDRYQDLFDPRLNAHYGAHYLRSLIDRFGLSAGIGRYHSQKSLERREHYRSLVGACIREVGGIEHAER